VGAPQVFTKAQRHAEEAGACPLLPRLCRRCADVAGREFGEQFPDATGVEIGVRIVEQAVEFGLRGFVADCRGCVVHRRGSVTGDWQISLRDRDRLPTRR
jgi:hypothetical protein